MGITFTMMHYRHMLMLAPPIRLTDAYIPVAKCLQATAKQQNGCCCSRTWDLLEACNCSWVKHPRLVGRRADMPSCHARMHQPASGRTGTFAYMLLCKSVEGQAAFYVMHTLARAVDKLSVEASSA